ncbi:TPA: DNA primase [Candidatus Peregrinibacteria bacterium]|nr:DNA primase [Candidatus Peregrinibacteria bacterium]
MADLVADIKARLSIEDVVANYIPLKRAGRSFKACCPFHNEKTPSFVVSPEKQIAYCFGCHQGGDMFKFVEQVENTDFMGAMRILADRAGLKLEDYKIETDKPRISKSEKETLIQMHEAAAEYFVDNLWNTEDGKKVMQYLKNRGMTDVIIRHFKVGFAPDNDSGLIDHLVKKGFQKSAMIKSGLVTSKDVSSDKIFDKFRMRLMFPIADATGNVIAFGGRALKDAQEPKYLNSPETEIYHKGSVLYGLYYAKKAIKDADEVVVVEGYMDTLMSFQSGIENVVASSGTALTQEHARMIKRITSNAVFAFDNDNAGQEASKRAFIIAQEQEMSIKFLKVPHGKDPADSAKENPDELKAAIKNAKPFLEVFFDNLAGRFDLNDQAQLMEFLRECMSVLSAVKNNIIQDLAVRSLSARINVKEEKIYDEIERYKSLALKQPQSKMKEPPSDNGANVKKMSAEDTILAILFLYPELFSTIDSRIDENDFENELKSLYKTFVTQYNNIRAEDGSITDAILKNLDSEQERNRVHFLSLYAESRYENIKAEAVRKDFDQLVQHVVSKKMVVKKEELKKMIKEADRKGDMGGREALLNDLQKLCSK